MTQKYQTLNLHISPLDAKINKKKLVNESNKRKKERQIKKDRKIAAKSELKAENDKIVKL